MKNTQYNLRILQDKDAGRMLEWLNDDSITKFLKLHGSDYTLADSLNFIKNSQDEIKNVHRAVVDENDCYLGTVSLKNIDFAKKEAEYAISMHRLAIGTGASSAATEKILNIAFNQLVLDRVYLNVLRVNQRAVRFYEKSVFRYTHTSHVVFNNERMDLLWYEIIYDNWSLSSQLQK